MQILTSSVDVSKNCLILSYSNGTRDIGANGASNTDYLTGSGG